MAEYSYSGVLSIDAIAKLQRKFGQPHTIVGAQLDKLASLNSLEMHEFHQFLFRRFGTSCSISIVVIS